MGVNSSLLRRVLVSRRPRAGIFTHHSSLLPTNPSAWFFQHKESGLRLQQVIILLEFLMSETDSSDIYTPSDHAPKC